MTRPRRWLLFVLLLVVALYAPFLGDYFWADDVAWIHGAQQAGSLGAWLFAPSGAFPYRPLAAALFAALEAPCGCAPWPYRALGLGLHLLNTWLVWRLARGLLGDERGAPAATALWAVHPALRWSVLWIADLSGLLSSTLALVALLAFDAHRARGRTRDYALALGAFALAVLAKETALALVLVLPVFDLWPRSPDGQSQRPLIQKYVPFALIALALALPTLASYGLRPGSSELDLLAWRVPANILRALLFMVVPVLNPNTINAASFTGLGLDLHKSVLLIGAPFVAAWLALLWRARGRRVWLLALWAPLLLAPLAFQTFVLLPFNGRYLYLPAIGYSLLLAGGGVRVVERWNPGAQRAALALFVAGALALAWFNAGQQWWVRNPEHPGELFYRIAWGGVLGCPLDAADMRAELVREGIPAPQADIPLLAPDHRYYVVSVIARALARQTAGDLAGARADLLAARDLAQQGDLDTRDENSGYVVPRAQVLAYLDARLAALGGP
jgi:hypothetical protein